MLVKILRHGHSQAIIIPAKFLKDFSIKKGETVELDFDYDKGRIILTFSAARQLRLGVDPSRGVKIKG